ncbi:MAG: single-stranded-DNA-specific exonuclease RecJ [Candidatus Moraniibacteriota bacterium]|nr:MAG: single-stranded-DNA-specific exonuclease RecJ [Candidatus Moranbacteria bacterium]
MNRRWNLLSSPQRKENISGESILTLLLKNRGVETEEERRAFLCPVYETDLGDPFLFPDMEKAVARVGEARENGETIGIFGDYDADGITSSVVLRRALERLSLRVVPYIPDKTTEGHGLHPNALDVFEREGIRLVFTVDCGMMNHAEIADANRRGMEVVVIDHHHVPEELPAAFAIINPKLPASHYPFRELCGAGTAFTVARALFARFLPERTEELKWLLDVVAIGTVADCMPLVGENRILVKYGLIVLSKTRSVGLQEMFQVGNIRIDEDQIPDAQMIAFQIAPRINAASRMAHAKAAHELLMTESRSEARLLALELENQNRSRQKVSEALANEVRAVAENLYKDRKLVFAVGEHYPLGVAGLVAGKIAHELGKPTAVFAKGETESTGSFRSIPALNIIEAIGVCSELLEKFGGHAQAAGATIRNENLVLFYEKLESIVNQKLAETDMTPTLDIDLELSPREITLAFLEHIKKLAPFGMGNKTPTFLFRALSVRESRCVGNGEKHLKLSLESDGKIFGAIGFGLGERWGKLSSGESIDVVGEVEENHWNGSVKLELRLLDICRSET